MGGKYWFSFFSPSLDVLSLRKCRPDNVYCIQGLESYGRLLRLSGVPHTWEQDHLSGRTLTTTTESINHSLRSLI
jgi:hypothetical protein